MALNRPGQRNCGNINRLTTAPALPAGWSKVGPGLWRHENGEESRINPASLSPATWSKKRPPGAAARHPGLLGRRGSAWAALLA
jgi:hypothetical protein